MKMFTRGKTESPEIVALREVMLLNDLDRARLDAFAQSTAKLDEDVSSAREQFSKTPTEAAGEILVAALVRRAVEGSARAELCQIANAVIDSRVLDRSRKPIAAALAAFVARCDGETASINEADRRRAAELECDIADVRSVPALSAIERVRSRASELLDRTSKTNFSVGEFQTGAQLCLNGK